jgi:hypothetical protein
MSLGITVSGLAGQNVLSYCSKNTEPGNEGFTWENFLKVFSVIIGNQLTYQETEEEVSVYDANDLVLFRAFKEGGDRDHANYRKLCSKLAPYLHTSGPQHRDPKFIDKFLAYYCPGTERWEGLEKWQQDAYTMVKAVREEWYPDGK